MTRLVLEKDASSDVNYAYAEVAKHMMFRLPIQNNLLRRLHYLHLLLRQKQSSVSSIKAALRKLPQVLSANDIDKLGN